MGVEKMHIERGRQFPTSRLEGHLGLYLMRPARIASVSTTGHRRSSVKMGPPPGTVSATA